MSQFYNRVIIPVNENISYPKRDLQGGARSPYDALDPQRPFQAPQRLSPQPEVASLRGIGRVWRGLALAPYPQDACVDQVDAAMPIQCIQATDDIVGLAGPADLSLVRRISGAVPPSPKRRHGP